MNGNRSERPSPRWTFMEGGSRQSRGLPSPPQLSAPERAGTKSPRPSSPPQQHTMPSAQRTPLTVPHTPAPHSTNISLCPHRKYVRMWYYFGAYLMIPPPELYNFQKNTWNNTQFASSVRFILINCVFFLNISYNSHYIRTLLNICVRNDGIFLKWL